MQKEWLKGKVDLYLEDLENDKQVKRSFSNISENLTAVQVEGFTNAIESLSVFPASHTVVVEEHKYMR